MLNNIQILRAIAASMVVLAHSYMTYNDKISPLDSSISMGGGLGVKIFFCISGIIIFLSVQKLSTGLGDFSYFVKRRIIRIVPIYWIATTLYILKDSVIGNHFEISDITYSLFFYPYINIENGLMRPILGLGWSLNYEMFFYFILAMSIFIAHKYRLLVVIVTLSVFVILNYHGAVKNESTLDAGYHLLATNYMFLFMSGMLIAKYIKFSIKRFSGIYNKYLAILIMFEIALYQIIISIYGIAIVDRELYDFVLCVLIIMQAYVADMSSQSTQIKSVLISIMVKAGNGSYSTYLFHWVLLGLSTRIINKLDITIDPIIYILIMLIGCNLLGYLVFLLLEKPITKILNSKVELVTMRNSKIIKN